MSDLYIAKIQFILTISIVTPCLQEQSGLLEEEVRVDWSMPPLELANLRNRRFAPTKIAVQARLPASQEAQEA